jgi:katanin p80 WD40 repeat-containing subunit B1
MESYTLQCDGTVQCCRITAASEGPVIAVGIDKIVSVYKFDKQPIKIQTLTGLTTGVSAVALDANAHRVAAGTHGGSLRLWDVATGEAMPGFTGTHRTTVTSLDYHPFGDFLASASRDTHMRIWDLRKKSCLQVYKHKDSVAAAISVVRITPEGLEVATGCEEGLIRLYDLRAGKAIHTFEHHKAPISSISFHPSRKLMSAISVDGVVSVWDLEEKKKMFATDQTQSTHCVVTEDTLFAWGASSFLRWRMPTFSAVSPSALNIGSAVSDVFVSKAGMLYVAGVNDATVKFAAVDPRGSAAKRSTSQPAAVRAVKPIAPVSMPTKTVTPPDLKFAPTSANSPLVSKLSPRSGAPPPIVPERVQPALAAVAANAGRSPNLAGVRQAAPAPLGPSAEATVDLDELLKRGDAMSALMQRRVTHLRVMRQKYARSVEDCMNHAHGLVTGDDIADSGAVVDLLDSIGKKGRVTDRVTLDSLPTVLRTACAVLSKHEQERYAAASYEVSRVLWSRFKDRINETIRGVRLSPGVDLALEERSKKCANALTYFEELQGKATAAAARNDSAGESAKAFLQAYKI